MQPKDNAHPTPHCLIFHTAVSFMTVAVLIVSIIQRTQFTTLVQDPNSL